MALSSINIDNDCYCCCGFVVVASTLANNPNERIKANICMPQPKLYAKLRNVDSKRDEGQQLRGARRIVCMQRE